MHYTLCDLLADLTQNAVEAEASKVTVEFFETEKDLKVCIRDNGKGMDADTLKRVSDPFFTDGIKHPNRKIGLGIPFLIQTTSETGGEWEIDSVLHEGTSVFARFDLTNIDTPPVGDVVGFFRQILLFEGSVPEYDLEIVRTKQGTLNCSYKVVRSELIDALGGIEDAEALSLMRTYLESMESAE